MKKCVYILIPLFTILAFIACSTTETRIDPETGTPVTTVKQMDPALAELIKAALPPLFDYLNKPQPGKSADELELERAKLELFQHAIDRIIASGKPADVTIPSVALPTVGKVIEKNGK